MTEPVLQKFSDRLVNFIQAMTSCQLLLVTYNLSLLTELTYHLFMSLLPCNLEHIY